MLFIPLHFAQITKLLRSAIYLRTRPNFLFCIKHNSIRFIFGQLFCGYPNASSWWRMGVSGSQSVNLLERLTKCSHITGISLSLYRGSPLGCLLVAMFPLKRIGESEYPTPSARLSDFCQSLNGSWPYPKQQPATYETYGYTLTGICGERMSWAHKMFSPTRLSVSHWIPVDHMTPRPSCCLVSYAVWSKLEKYY